MEAEQPEEVEHVSPEDADLLILIAGGAKSGKSVVANFISNQLSVSAKVDNQSERVHIKALHNIFNTIADKRIVIKEMPVIKQPIPNNLLATELMSQIIDSSDATIKVGDTVNHEIYGESKVTFVSTAGLSKPYVIKHKGGIEKCSRDEITPVR